MINPVQATSSSNPPADQASAPAPATPVHKPAPAAPDAEPNVRLTIDASPDGPFFVYTLQDRDTGRILAQLPQHRVETLGERADYHAGDVIRAKA